MLLMGDQKQRMTQGVSQGRGPTLNVLYDGVLRLPLAPGCRMVAYADDLVVVVNADKKPELISRAEVALGMIERWMDGITWHWRHRIPRPSLSGDREKGRVWASGWGAFVWPQQGHEILGGVDR